MLRVETAGPVVHLRLDRPAKRNAINDELIRQIHTAFVHLPKTARAAVVSGEGEHFWSIAQVGDAARQRVRAFLDKRADKVRK